MQGCQGPDRVRAFPRGPGGADCRGDAHQLVGRRQVQRQRGGPGGYVSGWSVRVRARRVHVVIRGAGFRGPGGVGVAVQPQSGAGATRGGSEAG